MRAWSFRTTAILLFSAALQLQGQEYLPPPPFPAFALASGDWGKINLSVTFAPNGHVSKCKIENYQVSARLAHSTAQFIIANWVSPANAGKSLLVPIFYSPPNLRLPLLYPSEARRRGIEGKFVVAVTFDNNGKAILCKVLRSTASSLLEEPTCRFILNYWRNIRSAGKTVAVPIEFRLSR